MSRHRDSIRAIEREIAACEGCPRLRDYCRGIAATKRRAYRDEEYWGRPVAGFGDPDGSLLIVGLAPGAHGANRTGRVFTGDSSGDFLFAALHRAGLASQPHSRHRGDGLTLRGAYVSAVARCAPPENRPKPQEIERCRPFLVREIAAMWARNLRGILALGAIAWGGVRSALDEMGIAGDDAAPPAFGHGVVWKPCAAADASGGHVASMGAGDAGAGLTVVASYHPGRQNTQTGRLTPAMFDRAVRLAVLAATARR